MIQIGEAERLVRRLAALDDRNAIEPLQNPFAVGMHTPG
jgi:hypothetical protein